MRELRIIFYIHSVGSGTPPTTAAYALRRPAALVHGHWESSRADHLPLLVRLVHPAHLRVVIIVVKSVRFVFSGVIIIKYRSPPRSLARFLLLVLATEFKWGGA